MSNFGLKLQAMLDHDRSAYAVQSTPSNSYNNFARGGPPSYHHPLPIEQEISRELTRDLRSTQPVDDQPPSPSATSAPIHIQRRSYNTYTPSYHGSPDSRSWQQQQPANLASELDSMYDTDYLDNSYNPDFDRSPLSHASASGHPSPYLTNAEDFLSGGLFSLNNANSPAFYVQPPTRNSTILSPPLDSFESFRYPYQKGVSPESSVGEEYLAASEANVLLTHRSHSRASSISSSHTHGRTTSQYGTGASGSPANAPGDLADISPHLTDFNNLQLENQWGGFNMSSVDSTSNGSDAGSNLASPYAKPMSPPTLLIPTEQPNVNSYDNASLFDQSQPGLAPPAPPSLGLIPATPVTPPTNQPKLGFQEILRQQVAQRRAASPLLNPSQQSDDGSGSSVHSPPNVPDASLQQTHWSTLMSQDLSQPQMSSMQVLPSMSDSNIFPNIGGPRPAIGAIPSGASNLGFYTTRTRSHSDPPSSQWGAALPAAIRPSPTHGQGNTVPSINLPGVNPNALGGRIPELNLGMGGSLWENAIDPMLGGLGGPAVQQRERVRSFGDNGARRGHIRGSLSDDMSYHRPSEPDQSRRMYTAPDGSLAPPSMSVPSSAPADTDEGGIGPRRRGHERANSGSHRASPYHSPHASPRMLPGDDNTTYAGINLSKPVERVHVTTPATREASSNRRTAQANFKCPVPGCGSTFTRHFNLRGHIRSHNEERPFKCKWPGCDKGFARQHDCKRHEALHLNIRPYTCEGCQKTFARMDALNRHLRSEGGTECQRVQSELTEGNPTENGQQQWDGNVVV